MSCASHDFDPVQEPGERRHERRAGSEIRQNGAPVLTAATASAPRTPTPMKAATRPIPELTTTANRRRHGLMMRDERHQRRRRADRAAAAASAAGAASP